MSAKTDKSDSPPIVSIVGLSGSGKTTLVVKLVKELTRQGLRVGTLKHSRHPHPMDMPGKDSWRHKEAGAERTLFVGPGSLQLVMDTDGREASPEELSGIYMTGLDLVIVEGFFAFNMPKLEVVRSERSKESRCSIEDGLIAMASDLRADELGGPGVPILGLDDVKGIAALLLRHFSIAPGIGAGGEGGEGGERRKGRSPA